jgi:hypothetical protein
MNPATVVLAGSKGTASTNATVAIVSQATANSSCSTGGASANLRTGGLALASLCLLLIPASRVRRLRGLVMLCVAAAGMSLMTGCGGGITTAASSSCAAPATQGTTPGNYLVTVTGTSGSTTASTSFTVSVSN